MAPSLDNGRILFIDAYDSFSENIASLLCQCLDVDVTMIHIDTRIDELLDKPGSRTQSPFALFLQEFDAVVLGPGPGNPEFASDVGLFSEIWKLSSHDAVPVLGICLGFQSLCVAYGGCIARLPEPCHGHAKRINHCGADIFANVGEVIATNYNSLEVKLGDLLSLSGGSSPNSTSSSTSSLDSFHGTTCTDLQSSRPEFTPSPTCPELLPLAWDDFGTLMAVKHVERPYWGLQFHPESCKSNAACQIIIKKWWEASTHWSKRIKPATTMPRPLLPSDHIWSRPLMPTHTVREPDKFTENDECSLMLSEELDALTTSSASVVDCRTLSHPVNGRQIAEFCKSQTQNDQAMLESTRKGRYSIYAIPNPTDWRIEYSLETLTCSIYATNRNTMQWKMELPHVLDNIHDLVAKRRATGGQEALPFWGGFIGFLSYEVGLERLGVAQNQRPGSEDDADISLLWVERSIVIDHLSDQVHVQSIRKDDSTWIQETVSKLNGLKYLDDSIAAPPEQLQELLASAKITLPDEESYKQKILACQSYLHSGDSYELCLTTEAQISLPTHPSNPWLLYLNLRHHNPVPFSAFLHLGRTTILSSSPEQFLTWHRTTGTIDMIPMKGTVAKSSTTTLAHATAILSSPKESAENLMIADLIRHDLHATIGRHSPVQVIQLCHVIEHETVYQLVSHIRAHPPIPPPFSSSPSTRHRLISHYGHKALRQTLPPGSMTGAPKKRSCEILARLEAPRRRGVYSGVLGFLDVGGGGAFAVCIRTAVSHQREDRDGSQMWRVGAGGAVTVLSEVQAEWEEMRGKLESVLRAFRVG